MAHSPTIIPGLRSPYEKVAGIYLFGRLLDKIRLQAKGQLPEAWVVAMGADHGFDGSVCRFLKIGYAEIREQVLQGGGDEQILEWVFLHGRRPDTEEIEIWNGCMMKSGWRDAKSERIAFRLAEAGLAADSVATMFDFIELDEGRPLKWG